MHVPYHQKTVQDTGTSSALNTYFDNIGLHGGPKKLPTFNMTKNLISLVGYSLPTRLDFLSY